MVIANDHYQSIGIVCLSVINVSCVSGLSALTEFCKKEGFNTKTQLRLAADFTN